MGCPISILENIKGVCKVAGGVYKLALGNFDDVTGKTLTTGTNGEKHISAITQVVSSKFKVYEAEIGNIGLTSKMNISRENGAIGVESDLTLILNNISEEDFVQLQTMIDCGELVALLETNSQKLELLPNTQTIYLGYDNPIKISALDINYGTSRGDGIKCTISLKDYSNELPYTSTVAISSVV